MKLLAPFSWRPTLAAVVLLAVFATAYRVAVRQPGLVERARLPARPVATAQADSLIATAPDCPPRATVFTGGSPAEQRPWVVRRYVGTVGGQAATAVLQWQTPDSATGRFYLHRGGPAYTLRLARPRPGTTQLAVGEAQDDRGELPRGTWQLATPTLASPTLTGTWHWAGRSQRLRLRESYGGALRYSFEQRFLLGDWRVPTNCAYVPTVHHILLTLPGSQAAPPALRAALANSPAALRRRVEEDVADGDASSSYQDEVRLNDFQLFSYQTTSYTRSYGGTPEVSAASWLYDLRTGEEVDLDSQLRPGYERPLRQRLTWHLLHDPALASVREAGLEPGQDDADEAPPTAPLLIELPGDNESLTLTEAGLEAAYAPAPYNWLVHLLVPYRELRPLVRPGTPLARMLRARGLW